MIQSSVCWSGATKNVDDSGVIKPGIPSMNADRFAERVPTDVIKAPQRMDIFTGWKVEKTLLDLLPKKCRVDLVCSEEDPTQFRVTKKISTREPTSRAEVMCHMYLAGPDALRAEKWNVPVLPAMGWTHSKEDDTLAYQMAYGDGGDLLAWTQKQIKSPIAIEDHKRAVKRHTVRVLHGMGYIHSLWIAHLDMKEENLVLSKDMSYIMDFGLALHIPEKRAKGREALRIPARRMGTTRYMCNELYSRKNRGRIIDATKADVYSMGIILWELLTGIPLFEHAHRTDEVWNYVCGQKQGLWNLVRAWDKESPEKKLRRRVDEQAANLIYKMVAENPRERPSIRKILQDDWLKDENKRFLNSKQEELMKSHSTPADMGASAKVKLDSPSMVKYDSAPQLLYKASVERKTQEKEPEDNEIVVDMSGANSKVSKSGNHLQPKKQMTPDSRLGDWFWSLKPTQKERLQNVIVGFASHVKDPTIKKKVMNEYKLSESQFEELYTVFGNQSGSSDDRNRAESDIGPIKLLEGQESKPMSRSAEPRRRRRRANAMANPMPKFYRALTPMVRASCDRQAFSAYRRCGGDIERAADILRRLIPDLELKQAIGWIRYVVGKADESGRWKKAIQGNQI